MSGITSHHSSAIKYSTRSSLLCSPTIADRGNAMTQTEFIVPEAPVRIQSLRKKNATLIEPRYLEAMSLLMSDNLGDRETEATSPS